MILKEITNWKSSSFHGTKIKATPYDLMNLAGQFNIEYYSGNDGKDKTNFDFAFETEDGLQFTVYDWKEYKPIDPHSSYTFHIGGQNQYDTIKGKEVLLKLL